jgi:hypothetical protein
MDEEYPSSEATEAFQEALTDKTRQPTFAGGYFPGLELTDEGVTTPDKQPLDLRGVIIDGTLDLTGAVVEVPLLLDGASITGEFVAEDATFEGPVSLVGTAISGSMYWQGAEINGGVVANELDAMYLDWRDISIEGELVFDSADFASSLKLPRSTISGTLSIEEAAFDWHVDATALSVGGDISAVDLAVDGDVDFVGSNVDGDLDMRKSTIGGDAEWDHTSIGGELRASDCTIDGEAGFDDVQVRGGACVFDGAQFGEKADFASIAVSEGRFSATEAVFPDEVWFTHAVIVDATDLSRAVFEGETNLRDAEFRGGLSLRGAEGTDQVWLHGSRIEGSLDCTASEFDYIQFSATVHGDADFERATFVDKTVFSSSTFHGRVWFDEASFAGYTDFSKARFTERVSFDDAEFLVEPSFEEARFAFTPDFSVAEFPIDVEIDPQDRARKWQLVLDQPESLLNDGFEIPTEDLVDDIVVPAALNHLVEDQLSRTKAVTYALSQLGQDGWASLIDDPLCTARTAVTQLDTPNEITLVFGVQVDPDEDFDTGFLRSVSVAGVYERRSDSVEFGHLDDDLESIDYLIPVPANDEAFDAGAAVATRVELLKAMLRHERLRFARLDESGDDGPRIHPALIPVLVGSGQLK